MVHQRLIFKILVVISLSFGVGACATGRRMSAADKADLHLNVARAAIEDGDPVTAFIQLESAEKLDPQHKEIPLVRALAFYQKKEISRARDEISKALKLDPENIEVIHLFGKISLDLGDFATAEANLKKAAESLTFRNAFLAWTNLGILYYKRGDYDQSKFAMQKALDLSGSNNCIAHYYLGHIFLSQNDFESALKSYERATQQLCGGFVEGHFAMGIVYSKKNQFELARRKFLEITRLYPNSKQAEQSIERLKALP